MKILLRLILLLILGMLLVVGWSMLPLRIQVTPVDLPADLPPANPPPGMSLSIMHTGNMTAAEMSAWRGGSPFRKYQSGMGVALVRHPGGDFLIDTGFGRDVESHLDTLPLLMKLLTSTTIGTPAAEQLRRSGYDTSGLMGILLTHAHWDHVSGISDFGTVPVWLNQPERDFIKNGAEHTAVARGMSAARYRTYAFDDQKYLGFESSLDVHGDGSIVLVPLYGHTPGSTGVFVNLPSGRRYFFVGDLVWQIEGIQRPAERPLLARRMVDLDPAAVRRIISHVHQISRQFPDIVIVPAHDSRVQQRIAEYPAAEQ